jgi:cyclophilin family peptidyl-prolyl cis-trans isomerase
MYRRIILTIIAAAMLLSLAGCRNSARKNNTETEAAEQADALTEAPADAAPQPAKEPVISIDDLPEEPVFDIVTNLGTIKVRLYKNTPKHRKNFAKLALTGYYDSLLFHRVINGFMIQGGDPNTRDTALVKQYGMGGPDYTIPAEFVPAYTHKKGALAAARKSDIANPKRESSGSQFYLVQNEGACAPLDGAYTVFGETISGLNVIDKIASVPTDAADRPLTAVRIITIKPDKEMNEQ